MTAQQDAAEVLAAALAERHGCRDPRVEWATRPCASCRGVAVRSVAALAAAELLVTPGHSCWEQVVRENATGLRTMAEHDAQVAARALREAAEEWGHRVDNAQGWLLDTADIYEARADRIEREGLT